MNLEQAGMSTPLPMSVFLPLPQTIPDVPFFSQFTDVSKSEWRTKACGVTSLAMLIEFYKPGEISVDALLNEGIASGAYLPGAGWIHNGLALLAKDHGLHGKSFDFAPLGMDSAFTKLENSLQEGPVIASVHYKLDPQNPIPHMIVVNGILNSNVYYNDPAESEANQSISIDNFTQAWKKDT